MNPRITTTHVFVTSDGERHTYRPAAELRQAKLDLIEALGSDIDDHSQCDLEELVVALSNNFSSVEQFVNDTKAAMEAANKVGDENDD